MQGIHGTKARLSSFPLRCGLDPIDFPEPDRVREVPVVERLFQPLLEESSLQYDLKVDERTCQWYAIRFSEQFQGTCPIWAN